MGEKKHWRVSGEFSNGNRVNIYVWADSRNGAKLIVKQRNPGLRITTVQESIA